jgi:cytochrome P450
MIYDPYSRECQENPWPIYRHFRDQQPCAYNQERDFYALFRFEDIWRATLDWQTYSSSFGPLLENRGELPDGIMSIIGMDPPRHTRLRNIVSKGFTKRRIGDMEPVIRELAARYLDPLVGAGGCDIQREFSVKFPMDVISVLLGIPEKERDEYRESVDRMLERDPDTGQPHADAAKGMLRSRALILDLLRERRREPQDDLVSLIANSEYEEPDGTRRSLDDQEVLGFCGLLAAAGAETTAKLIGNCVVYLHRHPEQRQRLIEDPAAIPGAIEEVLRYDAPSQFQGRVVLREIEVHGVRIPKLARVAFVTGAAGRDEREFADPDELDITRRPSRQLYFGYGQHVCLGMSLARLEARVALEEILARFPAYQVRESELTRTYQAHVRGFANVPIGY